MDQRTAEVRVSSTTEEAEGALLSRYTMVARCSRDAIIFLNPEMGGSQITEANRAAMRVYGHGQDEFLRMSVWDLLDSDAGEAAAHLARVESGPEGSIAELRHRRRDGAVFPAEIFPARGVLDGRGIVLLVVRYITDRKRTEEEIRYLGFHDALTGLYNHYYLEEELRRFDVEPQLPLSLTMGDVNGLKLVNDTLGHEAGNRLLVNMAVVLRRSCRKEDVIARCGGDEFVIVLPRTDARAALDVCNRVRQACARAEEDPVQPSIALGTTTRDSLEIGTDVLLREAEERIYRNKLMEGKSARSAMGLPLRKTLAERTHETEEHAARMQSLAVAVGRALDLSTNQLDDLALLSVLHDIGKIGIRDSVLMKPGRLTPDEWDVMRKHPEIGSRIAQSAYELTPVAEAILAHHEWCAGTQFDPSLVELFIQTMRV
ncbi:MAG: diguanylate cyclase [Firmicutes bacterium]|jgi:diguanylate cyclase (GGDEF)-like protein/PAS domain S-box-containing protein|nr:diguanylate cyclase [Bacillota bacterium]